MKELIGRLAKLSEPDRHLDAEIASAVGWAPGPGYRRCSDNSWRMVMPGRTESDAINSVTWPPTYTGSIDAALTLVPDGWFGSIPFNRNCDAWIRENNDSDMILGSGATPAIALCIAALKARESAHMPSLTDRG